ncbi:hypothetical protein BHF71_09205 [Vulcanibacillus modesticaldus]|uniref:Cell envelope-related transcriptional attenuator domain-containing protein n=1 Tax=Vulcanibacillus modesticaldus TaxID=337097 RepID=A0A1D2YUA6_9BACI|nr:LCP family protein [Vulcanibacillus modesticaldus]OEF99290.1 hypothetical protein BHF71_09205 [Vulcanibacillus modesticaldus]
MNKKSKHRNLSRVKKRKSKKKVNLLLFFSIFVILIVSGFTGYAYWRVNNIAEKIYEPSTNNLSISKEESNKQKNEQKLVDQSFAVVLVGQDYRPQTGSRNTDALIIGIFNPTTYKVSLLSIPRDFKVEVPGYGVGKINGVYAKGGPQLLMDTLSEYFGIPINYYVKIDFKGFEMVIDELGGIEVDVERDMYYYSEADNTNINLKKGLQILDGKQALDYARFRKSSNGKDSNDFERNERHQKIIKAFVDKLASIGGVTSIFDILEIVGDHIKTNLTPKDMKEIFWKYKRISKDDINSINMQSYWKNPYVIIEPSELERVQKELKKAFEQTKEFTKE